MRNRAWSQQQQSAAAGRSSGVAGKRWCSSSQAHSPCAAVPAVTARRPGWCPTSPAGAAATRARAAAAAPPCRCCLAPRRRRPGEQHAGSSLSRCGADRAARARTTCTRKRLQPIPVQQHAVHQRTRCTYSPYGPRLMNTGWPLPGSGPSSLLSPTTTPPAPPLPPGASPPPPPAAAASICSSSSDRWPASSASGHSGRP